MDYEIKIYKNKNMEKIIRNFSDDSAFVQIFGNDISKKYDIYFINEENEIIYSTQITQGCWAKTSQRAINIKIYDEDKNLIYDKFYKTITHNFNDDSAFVQIFGDDPNKKYDIYFIDEETNELVYSTQIAQGCWAKTSQKATNIKIYDEDKNLIYDTFYNTIIHNFNDDSAFVQIFGNDLTKKYYIYFINEDINEPIYSAQITQGCWSRTSQKATNVKVYDENGELIYDHSK